MLGQMDIKWAEGAEGAEGDAVHAVLRAAGVDAQGLTWAMAPLGLAAARICVHRTGAWGLVRNAPIRNATDQASPRFSSAHLGFALGHRLAVE